MSNAVATLTYADVPGFPAGSVVDHVDVSIKDASGAVTTQHVAPAATSVTFENVAAGTYTASANGVDAGGNVLGTPLSATFTISAGPATISLSLPSTLSVAQA